MANQTQLEQYLIDSTLLDSPVITSDPAFNIVSSGINYVIEQAVKTTGYTVQTLPIELEEYVILNAKKEIYFRLASLTAPEYNMETEFSKLLKGDRWEHYYKLIEITLKEIKRLDDGGALSTITTGDAVIAGRNGTYRNYRLATPLSGTVSLSNITKNSVEISWEALIGQDFSGYQLLIGTSQIYDEFADPYVIDANVLSKLLITDVHRTKYRLTELTPLTSYYLLFIYNHSNGYKEYSPISFTTLEDI